MDENGIKKHIQHYYSMFYKNQQRCKVPIKQGKDLAAALGYPLALLDFIPEGLWAAFAPCGNPLPHLAPEPSDSILNLGCGAAVDSFALLETVKTALRIVNLDLVPGVLREGSSLGSRTRGASRTLHWICGDGDNLPFSAASFDWVIVNGVLNLFPRKLPVLKEINRVLSPGGTLVVADLCSTAPLPDYFRQEKDAWAWCMSGAESQESLLSLFHAAGFQETQSRSFQEDDMFQRMVFSCRKMLN